MHKIYISKLFWLFACLFSSALLFAQSNTPCGGGGAPALTVNTSCSYTSGTTVGATQQTNAANFNTPSCGSMGEDVWYSFTAPAGGDVSITTQAGTITDGVMALYSSDCSGTFAELACSDDANGLMPEINISGLVAGETYYIRFWDYGGGSGTFDVCIIDNGGASAPANDDPCTATPITPGATCSFSTYTTAGATNSSLSMGVALPTCSNYNGGDVWFSVVAPASGHLIIDSDVGDITDAGMALYTGSCAGPLTEVDCDDDGSANGFMSYIEQTTLTPGQTYYIRIWEYGNDNPGTFDICVQDGGGTSTGPCSGGAGGATCGDMNPFCTDNTYCFTAQTGTTAEAGNDYGCLGTQPNPTWYYFEISTAGDLVFDMAAPSDIDFAVWGPFASLATATAQCGSLGTPVDCSFSTSPTEQANITGAAVGEVYILVVTNYAGVSQDITITTAGGNTSATNCTIINPPACEADAGGW